MASGSRGSAAAGGYNPEMESNRFYGDTIVWNNKQFEDERRSAQGYNASDDLQTAIKKEEQRLGRAGRFDAIVNMDREFVQQRNEFNQMKSEEAVLLANIAQAAAKEKSAKVRQDTKQTQTALRSSASGLGRRGGTILTQGSSLGGSDPSIKKTLLGA